MATAPENTREIQVKNLTSSQAEFIARFLAANQIPYTFITTPPYEIVCYYCGVAITREDEQGPFYADTKGREGCRLAPFFEHVPMLNA